MICLIVEVHFVGKNRIPIFKIWPEPDLAGFIKLRSGWSRMYDSSSTWNSIRQSHSALSTINKPESHTYKNST